MPFHLEKEALIASGVKDEGPICDYVSKLDFLSRRFGIGEGLASLPLGEAKGLFDALWKDRPNRYRRQGHFRLNRVIDAQLREMNGAVGNCLGLTLLYNCFLKRMGIEAEALYLENAFGIGPHVLTILRMDDVEIDVENILPEGFDYGGHKGDPSMLKWGDRELVSDIYQSIGTALFEEGRFSEALKNYDMALKLNPGYEKAALNRAILMDRMKTEA